MTSVAIVSVALSRVEYLRDKQLTARPRIGYLILLLPPAARNWYWRKESINVASEGIEQELKTMERLLIGAYKAGKVVRQDIEIEIRRLSYEVIDAVDEPSRFGILSRLSLSKWRDVKTRLDKLVLKLQASTSSSSEEEKELEIREGGGGDVLDRAREDLLSQEPPLVVCIVGESGMGKTTLAARLFHDAQLRAALEGFIWLSANQSFDTIWPIFPLEKEKRLIVVDGVENTDDWSRVRLQQHPLDRVIITTCSMEVARLAARTRPAVVYKISPLMHSDMLTIFNQTPINSDKVCKAIYDISGGSPLLAVILKRCFDESAKAGEQLVRQLASYMPHKGTARVLGVCYNRLSPMLKPCLLYLGHFPLGQQIHIEKLYLLLMAEKLISPMDSEIYLQSVKDVLEAFATKKLVQMKQDDEYCRLHDQVSNFCKFKASEEEFIEILDLKSPARVWPNTRRLFIYLGEDNRSLDEYISRDTKRKIRSLIVGKVGFDYCAWHSEINDLKEFVHLRVLDFNGVDFRGGNFPRGLDRLVLLRYLSFRGCSLDELPSSLSKLTHLETLDLLVHNDDPGKKMAIPHQLLANMKRLVHLFLPRLYKSGKSKQKVQLQALERLEVLVNLDASACDLAGVSKLRNLKILTTVPSGVEVLDYYPLMNYLGMLEKLQSVVVANNALVGKKNEIVISSAPHFPKLRTLKLHNLDSLEKLRIEQGAMPELSTLEIDGCPRLEKMTLAQQVPNRLKLT